MCKFFKEKPVAKLIAIASVLTPATLSITAYMLNKEEESRIYLQWLFASTIALFAGCELGDKKIIIPMRDAENQQVIRENKDDYQALNDNINLVR